MNDEQNNQNFLAEFEESWKYKIELNIKDNFEQNIVLNLNSFGVQL